MLGATWLRAGEVENCLLMPNADRCLFPVLPGGVHAKQEGAKNAAAIFKEYLAGNPDDLEVRWLLNLSYMLLGTYPQDVPAEYLLKPEIFRSEIRMPRFMDVAASTGFGTRDVAGGTIADDFDGDGLVDVILTSVDHCTEPRYYHNKGDGTFEDWTKTAGFADQFGAINAVQTDYNNDGKLDIFMLRGGWEFPIRNSLLRNNGDGTFTDVTKDVGLESGDYATHSAAWGDYDNDGWLDVFVAHELQPGQLFHNRGDGTFEDVTAKSGITVMRPSPRAWSSATTTTTAIPTCTCPTSSARTCCSTTTGTARSPKWGSRSASRSRSSASRPGSSTTTTTAGSTSSSRRTRTRSRSS